MSVVNNLNDTMKKRDPVDRGAIRVEEIVPRTDLVKHTSTTSRKYDYKNQDHTWVCVFCSQTSHYRGLGDLFGPYYIPSTDVKTPQKVRNSSQSSEGSTKKPAGKRQRRSNLAEDSIEASDAPTDGGQDPNATEIWFHEDCFIWIPNVFLIGGRIVGLEDGIVQCQELFCCSCEQRGASVGCTAPACRVVVHVHCGRQLHWRMDIDNFDAKCVEHLTPEERELIPKPLATKKTAPRRRLSKITSPGRRVASPPGRRVISPPARRGASPPIRRAASPSERRRTSTGRTDSDTFDRSEPQEREKERVLGEDSQTPQKERAAKRSISTNKSEDQANVTPVKVIQKDPQDIPVPREMVERQLSASVPFPPTSLRNESSSLLTAPLNSSNISSHGADINVPDPSVVPLIQPHLKDPAVSPNVVDSQTSTPLAATGPPTTPKEKPRSHKKKKPPKTPIPAVLSPPGAPLVVQTVGEEGAEGSESRQDTSSSLLLSPTTSMSSPPPGSIMSPGGESKEKKVRKRTKFDQATIDVLIR